MGWSTLAKPGTEAGPCLDIGCGHRDCAWTREQSRRPCRICGLSIGYDRAFYVEKQEGDFTRVVHASCAHEELEKLGRD